MVPPDAFIKKELERFAKHPGCTFFQSPELTVKFSSHDSLLPLLDKTLVTSCHSFFWGWFDFFFGWHAPLHHHLNSWQKVHSVFQSLWDWRCKMPMITFTSSGDESCTANDVLRCPNTWNDVHLLSPWKKVSQLLQSFTLRSKEMAQIAIGRLVKGP